MHVELRYFANHHRVVRASRWCSVGFLLGGALLARGSHAQPSAATPPGVEDDAQARAKWKEGKAAVGRGDLESARRAFLTAYELSHRPEILASLGQAELDGGHAVEAARHLSACLRMLAAAGPGNRSDTVQRSLEVAERQVATLIIRVSPSEDVLVRVDGETVETTLPGRETLWHVAPGPHTITAARQGYVPGELTVNAPRGERSVAVLQLKVVAPQTVTALEKKQVPERPHAIGADESPSGGPSSGERSRELPKPTVAPSAQTASAGGPAMDATRPVAVTPSGSARATLISGAGLTVLAAGGAAFFTVRASGLADDAAAMRAQIDALHGSASTPACPATPGCAELTQKLDERNHANNAATALWVSTGVLGAATALTYFLWPSPNSKASSGRAVTIVPAPAAAGASLAVSGRF